MAANWSFDNQRPIYSQIIEQIKGFITAGIMEPGERLPSVRDMAAEAGVNPNTMQRAMAELEREGLVYSQRTSGRFITEDRELIERTRNSLAQAEVRTFVEKMRSLNISTQQILRLIKEESE